MTIFSGYRYLTSMQQIMKELKEFAEMQAKLQQEQEGNATNTTES